MDHDRCHTTREVDHMLACRIDLEPTSPPIRIYGNEVVQKNVVDAHGLSEVSNLLPGRLLITKLNSYHHKTGQPSNQQRRAVSQCFEHYVQVLEADIIDSWTQPPLQCVVGVVQTTRCGGGPLR